MSRPFNSNAIAGQVPDTWLALPDSSIGRTGTGTGSGGGVGVGVGVGVGAGAGVGAGVGVGPGVGPGDAAACVAFTAVPATTIDTRRAAPEFADTTTRIAASPRPDGGVIEAHETTLAAVHAHAECV